MNEPLTLAEALSNFHFLRPLWLLALLPALWLLRSVWRRSTEGSAWQRAIDPELLPFLLDRRGNPAQRAPVVLLSLVWGLIIIALAGPTWQQIQYPAQKRQSAMVIALDQSLAMTVEDYSTDRQTVARRKLMDILDRRSEGQTGLVVYAGEAHVVTPLTEDNVTIRNLVPSLSPQIMPAQGNNPSHAVALALELLAESRTGSGQVLLITSGVSASQRQTIIELMEDTPFALSAIGVGTESGGPIPGPDGDLLRNSAGDVLVSSLDRNALESLSNRLEGRYHDLTLGPEDISHILSDALLPGEGEYADSLQEFDLWHDAGAWLLLLVLPLAALMFRRGWLLGLMLTGTLALSTGLPARQAQAQEFVDLWLNPDQQGARAFEEGEHQEAASRFESQAWRGAAHYRAGNYEAAVEAFAQDGDNPESLYNLGNALARLEMYEEAIAAYDAALSLAPGHEDALHNKAIVEELLEQQQQQEQQEQEDNEEEEESEEQQDQGEQEQEEEEEPQDQDAEQEPPEGDQREEQPQEQQPDEDGSQDQEQQLNLEETEDQESLEQWLRRLDDDPGELLQRKFLYEYRRRQIEARAAGRDL